MIYSNSNNCKGLTLNTNSVSRVKNWNMGDILYGLDEETIAFIEREKEKRNLLKLQKNLLQITKNAIKISQPLTVQSNIEGCYSKSR